jgi:tRNA nucleotidyltransferase (CCA-adding enzyme)
VDRLWGVPQKAIYHPEIDTGIHIMGDRLRRQPWLAAGTRYAALTHDLGKGLTPADILPAHHAHEAQREAGGYARAGACNARWPSWRARWRPNTILAS